MFAFVMVVGSALLASPQPPVPAEPESPAATPAPQSTPTSTPTPAPRPASKTPATPTKVAPPVPFPHPLITEVLYAVPTGDEGDVDGDGVRSATGDEFVELINPHARPIRLKGYVLTDGRNLLPSGGTSRNSRREPPSSTKPAKGTDGGSGGGGSSGGSGGEIDRKSRIRFEFPDITLQPGQVVVVFNGFKGKDAKRVTDPGTAPKTPVKAVAGAPAPIILSMAVTSQFAAFANTGDCVLLLDAKGNGIQCIAWGEKTKPPEDAAPLLERAPEGRGSVTRVGLARGLGEHSELDDEGLLFSPGVHVMTPDAEPQEPVPPLPSAPATPAPSPAPESQPPE